MTAATIAVTLCLAAGCSSASAVGSDAGHMDAPSRACDPGRSVACAGPGGCAGAQACRVDGLGYDACDCGTGTDAGATDAAAMLDVGVDGGGGSCGCIDADPEDCVQAVCDGTTCRDEPLPDGMGCLGGNCVGGVCCPGCRAPEGCSSGDVVTACGGYGGVCVNCEDGNPCTIDVCQAPGICAARTNAPSSTLCPGGFCSGGVCVITSDAGSPPACAPGMTRRGASCVPCGAAEEACCLEAGGGDLCAAPGTICRGDLDRCTPCGERGEWCCNVTGPESYSCVTGLACNTRILPAVCDCGYHFGPCCGFGGCNVGAGVCRCASGGVDCTCQ